MLEKLLQKGMAANWLPTNEAGARGDGKEMSKGIEELKVQSGKGIYLPFAPNGINFVESQGKDVISYNFTGCIMAAYTKGGQRRVAHVSTGAGQDCKSEWNSIAKTASSVLAFKPHEAANIGELQKAGQAFNCYGLITANGDCFSIVVGGKLSGANKTVIVVSCDKVSKFV